MNKNYTFIVLVLFLYIPQAFAGFTLSGSTITQSGTDTDLSGLSGITGVTVTVEGGVTYYNIGTRQLNITGNLTVDGRTERLSSSYSPTVNADYVFQVSGQLTINNFENKFGDLEYFQDVVFYSTYVNTFCCGRFGFRVSSSGTLVMNGGYIRSDSSVRFEPGSRLEITNAGFVTDTSTGIQMRFFTDDFDIDGLFVKNYLFAVGVNALGTSNLNGLELYGGFAGASGSLSAGSEYIFRNFRSSGIGSNEQAGVADYNFITFINAAAGSELNVRGQVNDTRSAGLYRNYKTVKVKTTELSGAAIEGAQVYIKDTNHGNRRDWTASNTENDNTNINFTNDRIYNQTTNSSGETNEFEVLLSVLARPAGNQSDGLNTGLNTIDIRGKNNNNSDLFDFYFWSYEHLPAQTEQELKGVNTKNINWTLFADANITETTKATVDAYTSIDNLNQLYDRAKSWNVDNVGLGYPTVGAQLIDGDGTKVDLDNINLIVNASVASAFAVNTGSDVVTIKAASLVPGNRFESIKTTGTISLQNGAELKTGYEDSTGTYVYLELTNLDQQTILVTDQQNSGSPVTLLNIPSTSGTYATHFQLPPGGEINVLVERAGYAPWTETIPDGDLNFVREVSTSLSAITAENQIKTIDLLIKLLQKTEAVLHTTNVQSLPVPSVSVSTTITASSGSPSVTNQEAELALLRRILVKMTAVRETVNQN